MRNFHKIAKRGFSGKFISNKTNTILNICSQNEIIIIERLGQFKKLQKPGVFLAFPIIDKLKYVIDTRELTLPIVPQHAITQDNVSIEIGGVVYIRFVDPYKAAYGVSDPIYAIRQFAQAAMRAVVGKHTLDEIFHKREILNDYIIRTVKEGVESWGATVLRYEITDINVSETLREAMSKQAAAERRRREDVLHAEALKKSQILESEGYKEKLINESEGLKIKVENEAVAFANATRIKGDANKYAAVKSAEGLADSFQIVGEQLQTESGQKAAQNLLATRYIEEFGKIVGKSSNLIIPADINDVSGFISKAIGISNLIAKKNDEI